MALFFPGNIKSVFWFYWPSLSQGRPCLHIVYVDGVACLHIHYVDAVSCLHIVYVDATTCLHIVQVICYLVITWFCVNLPRSCCNIGWANSELVNVSKLQIDVNGAFRHSGWVLKETVAHAHNNFNIMVDQTQKRQGVASPPCDKC